MQNRNPNQQGGPGNQGKPPNKFQPPRTALMLLLVFGLVVLLFTFLGSNMTETGKQSRSRFYRHLAAGQVSDVTVTENKVKVTLHTGAEPDYKHYEFEVLGKEDAGTIIAAVNEYNAEHENEVELNTPAPSVFLRFIVTVVAPTAVLILLLYFIFFRSLSRASGGGVLSFGKSRARIAAKGQTKVTFDDVAGIDEARQDIQEIVEFLKHPEKFSRLGARVPRGVLLVGAPGTGKTLLAKAIAGEAEVPFYSISGSDFVEMFVGVGASRVRDLFRQAKENAPCIIFLDEIDAVGRKRGTSFTGGGHDEREQTLNAILVEMDGFESDQNVVIIAATNRPDVLDPALKRPGRFDREIVVDMPDVKGREAILEVHARRVKLADDVDLSIIARGTPMFTGADLEAVINEAAILAGLKGQNSVTMADLEEARDKVRWGRQRRSRVMAQEDRRITAFHESGHAVAMKLLPNVEPLHKVTIIPRGMALGATMQLPERDKYHVQRRELVGQIVAMLAGRVAEEMFCEDISSGAQDDLRRATNLARSMVREWGMSGKLGLVYYGDQDSNGREPLLQRPYSESTAVQIDKEVQSIVDDAYQEAKDVLESHRDQISRVAEALLEREVLEADDVDRLLAGEPLAEEIGDEKPPQEGKEKPDQPEGPSPREEAEGDEGAPEDRRQTEGAAAETDVQPEDDSRRREDAPDEAAGNTPREETGEPPASGASPEQRHETFRGTEGGGHGEGASGGAEGKSGS